MRVRGVYHAAGEPDPTSACYPYSFGETEDYGITIETSTGLHEPDELLVGLYPNPAAGTMTVAFSGTLPATLELLDLQGRAVMARIMNSSSMVLDLSMVAAGSYLVRISHEERSVTQRLEVLNGRN
jgi:hypothetical protein